MKTFMDIDYCDLNDDRRKLDIYLPDGECTSTVLWTHGGGLEEGSRKDPSFPGIAEELGEKGIAFVSVEYRMYPEVSFPAFIEDYARAAAFIYEHAAEYGLSEKIFIGGTSAGGYLTLMLCFARKYLEAAGREPEDFAGFIPDAGQPTTHYNILKYRGEDSRLCRIDEAAPIWHITDARPGKPIRVICADNDLPARPEQNRLMLATMKHFGYDMSKVDSVLMEGYTHCGYSGLKKDGHYLLAGLIADFVQRV